MKLNANQQRALAAINAGEVFPFHRQGNLLNYLDEAAPGSYAVATIEALRRRGLVQLNGWGAVLLTPAGREFLADSDGGTDAVDS